MTKNNSSRVLVNLLGVPTLLSIIFLGDTSFIPIFSLFISTIVLLGVKEIKSLVFSKGGEPSMPILIFFLLILQCYRIFADGIGIPVNNLIVGISFSAMIFEIFRKKKSPFFNVSITVFSFVWLGLMLGSLSELRNLPDIGFEITFIVFISVWICDSAAFIFGKKYGKKKILPDVSPNKTWLGTIAGFISTILVLISIFKLNFLSSVFSISDMIFIAIITGLIGQFGDWSESLFKREAEIKDTSNILKGHGGILDRFDSLIFASPIVLIYCKYFILRG